MISMRVEIHSKILLVSTIYLLIALVPVSTAVSSEIAQSKSFVSNQDAEKIRVAKINKDLESRQVIKAHPPESLPSTVTSNAPGSRSSVQTKPNRGMEFQLHYVTEFDTRESLARKYLGDSSEWLLIALHNELNPQVNPAAGTVLRIPVGEQRSAKLVRDNVSTPVASLKAASFFSDTSSDIELNPAIFSDGNNVDLLNSSQAHVLAARVDATSVIDDSDNWVGDTGTTDRSNQFGEPAVVSRKIDMFAGEARVFGKVDVSRVAVGNGSILRAEVLANGDLLAIAQAEGSSSLHLWHKDESRSDLNIRVSAQDPEYRVKLEKSIRMRVKMIEFRRSAVKRLGIDWGDSIEGPVFATAGDIVSNSLFRPSSTSLGDNLPLGIDPFATSFGIATQLTSRINFLVNNGDAEMLAEPVLSCLNGGSAKFLAGGEVPYPTVGANGQTNVEFREYGIRLEVSPVADENGNIQASILTEVSSIDPSVTVLGAPGLLTRRTQTQVSVTNGDTIVIAGLLQSESGKDIDALPGIGRLPILGKLFRSDNLRNNVSELVIFITPEIVDPSRNKLSRANQGTHEYSANRLQIQTEKLRKAWIK